MKRKGIILAGGSGTRLYPVTKYVCKQLLPIYDKPLLHYPIYTLAKIGITDILIISTPETTPIIEHALGDGKEYGLNFEYKVQEVPNGLAQAFVLGKEFIGNDQVCLILGDNIFYGNQLQNELMNAMNDVGPTIFGWQVSDPERYGVAKIDDTGKVIELVEKPKTFISNLAIPGIYFYDSDVVEIAENLKPSARGEYEITDVNKEYLRRGTLKLRRFGIGNAWLDAGTFQSLNDASNFIRTIQERTGVKISDLESFKTKC